MKSRENRTEQVAGSSEPNEPPLCPSPRWSDKVFALACGGWIGLSFLKFGNPIIFEKMIEAPKDWAEFVFTPWPIAWGYVMLALVIICSIPIVKPRVTRADWPLGLLGFWLVWQFFSNANSVDSRLSNPTVMHFVTCGASLLLGMWALAPLRGSSWFWGPLLGGAAYVLFAGFEQHAGGLEATRQAFYAQPNWQSYPKEYLLKIASDRIFATLVYPNALAGLLLLVMPSAPWQAWRLTERWPRIVRGVLIGMSGYLALACFYWTGSKGGWLIALIVAGVFALQLSFSRKLKTLLIAGGLALGLAVFFFRFSGYFQKGATSVGARFTYWKAAVQIAKDRPFLGSGPGTFSVLFKQMKAPEAEMAKLVHNDYLEQFSDSGIPGGLAFAAGLISVMALAYGKVKSRLDLLLWLGLLGWVLQGFIEFGLYIPALAWPAFLFLGALWGSDRKVAMPAQ